MKKFLALLMAMLMLVVSASALADTAINWADVEEAAAAIDADAQFYEVSDIGLAMWIPGIFNDVELTDEDVANGTLCLLATEDESAAVYVAYTATEGTLDDLAAAYTAAGMAEVSQDTINGIPAVTYQDTENDSFVVTFLTDAGNAVMFVFAPISDEGFQVVAAIMAASLQPME